MIIQIGKKIIIVVISVLLTSSVVNAYFKYDFISRSFTNESLVNIKNSSKVEFNIKENLDKVISGNGIEFKINSDSAGNDSLIFNAINGPTVVKLLEFVDNDEILFGDNMKIIPKSGNAYIDFKIGDAGDANVLNFSELGSAQNIQNKIVNESSLFFNYLGFNGVKGLFSSPSVVKFVGENSNSSLSFAGTRLKIGNSVFGLKDINSDTAYTLGNAVGVENHNLNINSILVTNPEGFLTTFPDKLIVNKQVADKLSSDRLQDKAVIDGYIAKIMNTVPYDAITGGTPSAYTPPSHTHNFELYFDNIDVSGKASYTLELKCPANENGWRVILGVIDTDEQGCTQLDSLHAGTCDMEYTNFWSANGAWPAGVPKNEIKANLFNDSGASNNDEGSGFIYCLRSSEDGDPIVESTM